MGWTKAYYSVNIALSEDNSTISNSNCDVPEHFD